MHAPEETGRGSARLERTVRVREDGGSNPPAPTARQSSTDFCKQKSVLLCQFILRCNCIDINSDCFYHKSYQIT